MTDNTSGHTVSIHPAAAAPGDFYRGANSALESREIDVRAETNIIFQVFPPPFFSSLPALHDRNLLLYLGKKEEEEEKLKSRSVRSRPRQRGERKCFARNFGVCPTWLLTEGVDGLWRCYLIFWRSISRQERQCRQGFFLFCS